MANATNIIELSQVKNEARVDSRMLAEHIGIQHKNVLATIDSQISRFERFGPIAFKTRKGEALPQGGFAKPTRYALLNEDQSYLLLTFSKNTDRVADLKVELVMAFSRFRQHTQVDSDYLPYYHELHDSVKSLADVARQNGSSTDEKLFHINFNRLINKAFGIDAGSRKFLPGNLRAKVTAANVVAKELLDDAIKAGLDHKAAYQHVKKGIESFANLSRSAMVA